MEIGIFYCTIIIIIKFVGVLLARRHLEAQCESAMRRKSCGKVDDKERDWSL